MEEFVELLGRVKALYRHVVVRGIPLRSGEEAKKDTVVGELYQTGEAVGLSEKDITKAIMAKDDFAIEPK